MSATNNYAATPRAASKLISAANTNRDGTGTIVDVFAAGTSGSRIERAEAVARGTTTAGVVRLFIYDGTTYFLFEEIMVTAATPSTSIAVWSAASAKISPAKPLWLPTGYKLAAGTHNAENFNVAAFGGDY